MASTVEAKKLSPGLKNFSHHGLIARNSNFQKMSAVNVSMFNKEIIYKIFVTKFVKRRYIKKQNSNEN